MIFNNITILDENFAAQEDMYVAVKDEKIAYIGKERPDGYYGRCYDGRGKLLMPAFYNSHGHSPMSLMRGYGENMALQDWLSKRIFPFEEKLTGEAVYWGTMLSMAESARFGIVSTTDMYYFLDDMAAAVSKAGMKSNLSRGIVQFDDSNPWEMVSMAEMKKAFEKYHNSCGGKIKIDMCIHGEYTSKPETVKAVAEYAKAVGGNMHIHISETQSEHLDCKERHGKTPVRYFADLGAWDVPATAAHCVWIEGEDFDILKEKNVTVASNPASNLKLASGVCNVPELLRKGVNVAIGTDSVASNNNLNFFEEMKLFAMTSKMMYKDPTAVTPVETLRAATVNGARGQGRFDCGLVKEGFKADLIVLDIDKPYMSPVHSLATNLVYSAVGTDVELTMADGEILYENGEYKKLDIEATMFNAQKATTAILKAL